MLNLKNSILSFLFASVVLLLPQAAYAQVDLTDEQIAEMQDHIDQSICEILLQERAVYRVELIGLRQRLIWLNSLPQDKWRDTEIANTEREIETLENWIFLITLELIERGCIRLSPNPIDGLFEGEFGTIG